MPPYLYCNNVVSMVISKVIVFDINDFVIEGQF